MGLSSASADREGVVGVIITLGFLGENEFILLGFLPLFLSSVDDLRFCWTEDKNTTIFWIWLLLAEFRILMIYSLATSVKMKRKSKQVSDFFNKIIFEELQEQSVFTYLLKGGYPIIFASNVFHNSQLLILYTLLNQMRVVKNIRRKDDRITSF